MKSQVVLLQRSHPRLVTVRTNAHRKAVCRRQNPQLWATAAPSAANATRLLRSGCFSPAHTVSFFPACVTWAPGGERLTLVGLGAEKVGATQPHLNISRIAVGGRRGKR